MLPLLRSAGAHRLLDRRHGSPGRVESERSTHLRTPISLGEAQLRRPSIERMKRILVVDDSDVARMHVVRALSAEYVTVQASNGAEAFEKACGGEPFDAVVTDLEMPEADGRELLRRLRADARTQQLPVIIVTTVTDIEWVNSCRALGCSGFALKPIDPPYLLAKLRKLLG